MDNSKQFLKNQDILPRISFKDGKEHIVKLLNDKIDKIQDGTGKEIEGVKYLVEEDNENKSFFTSSIGLIAKLADLEENTMVGIKMIRKKTDAGYRSSFEVRLIDDNIPVIENETEPSVLDNEDSSSNIQVEDEQ